MVPDHAADTSRRHLTGLGSRPNRPSDGTEPSHQGRSVPILTDHEPGSIAELIDWVLIRVDRLRDRPVISTAVMLLLGMVVASAWWFGRPGPVVPVEDQIPMAGTVQDVDAGTGESSSDLEGAGLPDETAEPLVVHVSGEVTRQGVVELAPGARIADAIAAAGGPTTAADIHQLNLAAGVVDGMHIRVPVTGSESTEPLIETGPGPAADIVVPSDVTGGDSSSSPNPVDINRADTGELETLPGIGPALAQAIIRWRTENGGFAAVDDLLLVPGIGPAKLAALSELVTT